MKTLDLSNNRFASFSIFLLLEKIYLYHNAQAGVDINGHICRTHSPRKVLQKKFNPVFLTTLSFHLCQIVFLLFFRLKLSSNEITTLEFGAFNHLINIQKVFFPSFSLSSPIFAVAFNLQKFLFIFVAMLLLLSFIFGRLKLSSNMITTLEFGAFNHLINIQKVLDFFDDDGDGDDYGDDDGDYLCRWTCLTILWSVIVTWLGSLITGF